MSGVDQHWPSELRERARTLDRRRLLTGTLAGLGLAGLHELGLALPAERRTVGPHHAPRAKRVIYLFLSGGPSQIDLMDPKPGLVDLFDTDLPPSVIDGQRFTTMTSGQERFPVAPSRWTSSRHGESGLELTELLPYTARLADRLCVVRSLHTDSINHDPGITFLLTGAEQPGRPSFGSWLSYGLGSPNRDLPAFCVLTASWSAKRDAQALFARLWSSGYLPSRHQGVALRSTGDPVLYLSDPDGVDRATRRRQLDAIAALNEREHARLGDPGTRARIEQAELAFRMQAAVPELTGLSDEPEHVLELYGPDVRTPGTFAASCLLARRLAERGVTCTQIFHRGWDTHDNAARDLPMQAKDTDQATWALVTDLAQRGLLEDTLVVCGGEFGRTAYCQGPLSREDYGRDHHPRAFTMWLCGGGAREGHVHGETDDFAYNVVRDQVSVHDLNATLLYLLGFDHERLVTRYQGRDFRLTDVEGHVVTELLA